MPRATGAVMLVLGGPLAIALLAACRAIAGIDGDLSYAPGQPDAAGTSDAHADAKRDGGADAKRPFDAGTDAIRGDAGHDAMRDAMRGDAGHDAMRADAQTDSAPRDGVADAELPDANACPAVTPEQLFVLDGGLGPILLSDASVYAELVFNDTGPTGPMSSPYSGLIVCAKDQCTKPITVADYSAIDAPAQWGEAALGPLGLYYSLSSLSPNALDFDSGAPQDAGSISFLGPDATLAETVRGGLADPFTLAMRGNTLYWVDDPQTMDFLTAGSWRVFRCTLPQCADPELFMQGTPFPTYGLYLDSANVYVLANSSDYPQSMTDNLYACPMDASCPTPPNPLVLELYSPEEDEFPADPLTGGDNVTSDGTTIFLESFTFGQVSSIAGGQEVALANVRSPGCLAVDDTYLYWTAGMTGDIQRTRKDGAWNGDVQSVLCRAGMVTNMAVDGTYVYYETLNGTTTTMWRVPVPPAP